MSVGHKIRVGGEEHFIISQLMVMFSGAPYAGKRDEYFTLNMLDTLSIVERNRIKHSALLKFELNKSKQNLPTLI